MGSTTMPTLSSKMKVLEDVNTTSQILAFLNWKDILRARVCRKWKEAAKLTEVPESRTEDGYDTPELFVRNHRVAEALGWISEALPRMPSLHFLLNRSESKYIYITPGENSRGISQWQRKVVWDEFCNTRWGLNNESTSPPMDFRVIANFRRLRTLVISSADLNGFYPCIFDFPELKCLELSRMPDAQWDLSMISGLPKLERLKINRVPTTGRLSDLRVIREGLTELSLCHCTQVEGNLMDLADFPVLKNVTFINCSKIAGDIRDIGPSDFSAIESDFMDLPQSVYGAGRLPSVAETPEIMNAWYTLKKRNHHVFSGRFLGLSTTSKDYRAELLGCRMPICVEFVSAGSRLGWRWTNARPGGACETIWIDPEPDPSDATACELYLRELKAIRADVGIFQGFREPPSEKEFRRRKSEMTLPSLNNNKRDLSFERQITVASKRRGVYKNT